MVNPIADLPTDFTQTVLLVDDQVFSNADDTADVADAAHPISSRDIIEALADKGVGCTVLGPGTSDDPDRARVVALSATADVLVLDWILGPGTGNDSLPLLQSVLQRDLDTGGRLRLVVFYTGYEVPSVIVEDVVETLQELGLNATVNGLTVTAENLRVVVLGKPDSTADIEKVGGAELAARLPYMFTEAFADGLLRRVALAGVVAVRQHVHKLLTRFPAELDQAFLSHRGMTSPVAAEQFARQLVTDEIATVLTDATIERWVYQEEVDKSLEQMLPGSQNRFKITKSTCTNVKQITRDEARELLSAAKESQPQTNNKVVGSLTTLFDVSGDESITMETARRADERFTVLALFSRTHCFGPACIHDPRLGLGSVLDRDGQFWLCVQPLCDSVRLPETPATSFPLLPLQKMATNDSFDLVLPVEEELVRLQLTIKLKQLILPRFFATSIGTVTAPKDDDGNRYFQSQGGERFRWLGQLRLDPAHRIASLVGQNAARIGLDEPEWSRRRAPRGRW